MIARVLGFLAVLGLPAWFALGAWITVHYQITRPIRAITSRKKKP